MTTEHSVEPVTTPLTNPAEQPTEFTFVWGKDYLALPRDPQPWLIKGLVPSGGLINLYGKPKLGKSWAALGMAIALSDPKQTHWLGYEICKHGRVLYLQVDTPRSEWARRTEKLVAAGYNISGIGFTDANLVPYPVDITQETIREALERAIVEMSPAPVLLVIDTLREIHNGNENDSGDMKKVITGVVKCCYKQGISVMFVSHSRKDISVQGKTADDDLMNDGRGSSYTSGRMDIVMKLTEKQLILKGRSIGDTRIAIEQDAMGMITADGEKQLANAHIEYVLENPQLHSDRERAEMLAALEGIELEAARSRIRTYKKRHERRMEEAHGTTTISEVFGNDDRSTGDAAAEAAGEPPPGVE